MARQLTVGSRSARMCLRAVTDTQAQQEGLGCGAHGGGWALCRKGRAVGGGPAARERGARVFAGLGPGTAGAPGGVAGARPVQDQPGGAPAHFPRPGSVLLSPEHRGSQGLRLGLQPDSQAPGKPARQGCGLGRRKGRWRGGGHGAATQAERRCQEPPCAPK